MSTAQNQWTPEEAPPAQPAPALGIPASPPVALPATVNVKVPLVAGVLSLFPGLGNVYNGLYLRGLAFFVLVFSIIGILANGAGSDAAFFGPAVAFFWLFNIIDAYRQAVLINHGYQQDFGILDLPKRPRAGQGGIAAGAVLVLVGTYALLEQYVNIDLDWLFDLWPVVAIALGLWLIWGTIRDRKRDSV